MAIVIESLTAYWLWLIGGPLGLHMVYLDRVGDAVLYSLTGGLFLFGWLGDFFRIPWYVRQRHGDQVYCDYLTERMEKYPARPRFSLMKQFWEVALGMYCGMVIGACNRFVSWATGVPATEMGYFLEAFGVAFGVYIFGNMDKEERTSFKPIFLVSCLYYVFLYITVVFTEDEESGKQPQNVEYHPGLGVSFGALLTSFAGSFGRSWVPDLKNEVIKREKKVRGQSRFRFVRKLCLVYLFVFAFLPFLFVGVYHHGAVTLNEDDGSKRTYKIKAMVDTYLDENVDWEKLKTGFGQMYEFIQREGFTEFYYQVMKQTSQQTERESLRILELDMIEETITYTHIRKSFRKLSLKYHPDRQLQATPEERDFAEVQYIKIVQAFEFLSEKYKEK